MSEKAKTLIGVGIVIAMLGGLAWLLTWKPGLGACEDEIKAQLKAPSTYRRISVDGSGGFYNIEYDAENSFGVPLRGKGMCTVEHGNARWLDLSATMP